MKPETYYNNNFYGFDKNVYFHSLNLGRYFLLKLENHQKEILKLFHKSNNVSIVKSRQIGMTSILALYVSYIMLYGNKKTIVICCNSGTSGNHFLNKLKGILFKEYPFKVDKNHSIDGENHKNYQKKLYYGDCYVKVVTRPKEVWSIRNPDLLIIDEACYVNGLEDFLGILAHNVLSNGGQAITASSIGGPYDEAFKKWHKSIEKEFYTYKRELILEKSKNIILNNESMFYRAKFNQKSF